MRRKYTETVELIKQNAVDVIIINKCESIKVLC